METRRRFTAEDARSIGEWIGIEWGSSRFDVEQFRMGLEVELEHGRHDPETNVTDDDELVTARSPARTSTSFRTTTLASREWRRRRSTSGPGAHRLHERRMAATDPPLDAMLVSPGSNGGPNPVSL
jgi:Protein of unknown function (DUF5661)